MIPTRPAVVVALLAALLVPARVGMGADFDLELRAAQQELKVARRGLQNAPRRYEGRRQEAMDHVKAALREIRLGLLDAASDREHSPQQRHMPAHPH